MTGLVHVRGDPLGFLQQRRLHSRSLRLFASLFYLVSLPGFLPAHIFFHLSTLVLGQIGVAAPHTGFEVHTMGR
jgi:hypothetical protein